MGENMALEVAAHAIRQAITNAGPQPEFHQQTLRRHRSEWPTLWSAIDSLLDAMENPYPKVSDG
jgi:hypothetical protein